MSEAIGLICEDCVQAIANGDFTGLDYHYDKEESARRQEAIKDGITAYHDAGFIPVVGKEAGFSVMGCDCCEDPDAGERHELYLLRR